MGVHMSIRLASRYAQRAVTTASPLSPRSRRQLSTVNKNSPKVAVISGAGGATARTPTFKFLEEGYKVVGLTSNPEMQKHNSSEIQYVLTDRTNIQKPAAVKEKIMEGMEQLGVSDCTHLVGLNLIGGSVAPKGSTLMKLNLETPMAFMSAIKATGEDTAAKTSFVHISSIAATVNGQAGKCDYATIKREADQAICALSDDHINALILRPGIILPEADLHGRVNMGHDYSPEQMAKMFLIPVVGSGDQILYYISEECLYEAMVKGVEVSNPNARIVDAGVPIQQKRILTYFNENGVAMIHIPYGLAKIIAEHFPLGRMAPYSVRMLETLDHEKENNPVCGNALKEILGREPRRIESLYSQGQLVGRKSPVFKHIFSICQTIVKDPKKGLELAKGLKHIREIRISPKS
jgi:nucleoside-diphosphate-sugar epimerase